jgi:molybdate transport system ATP-binding protein
MSESANRVVLRVDGLRKRVHADLELRVSLELGREFGIVFGPSGAGKTTLLRLIAGLMRPDSGRIVIGDRGIFDREARVDVPLRHRRIGMIFQDDLLFPHLSVAGNIGFGLDARSAGDRRSRVEQVARQFGVGHLLDRDPRRLSGGERQRVGLARAVAPRPELLLCDEPVSGLDADARLRLVDELAAIQAEEGIPVLYVTHNTGEAIRLGARAFVIRSGAIVAEGAPLEVILGSTAPGARDFDHVTNVWRGRVLEHALDGAGTLVSIGEGVVLSLPRQNREVGASITIGVRSDDILISSRPVDGLSARNQIQARVEQLVSHGGDVELVAQVGGTRWIVSLVAPAVESLGIVCGGCIWLIVKSRSILVVDRRDGVSSSSLG